MPKKSDKCATPYCRNDRGKNRRYCYKCVKRKHKIDNPMRYAFDTLKSNAQRRGKEFSLTFEEFKKFCAETGYMDKKGKTATSMSIDRKENDKGYTYDNMQLLSLADNTAKGSLDQELVDELFGKAPEDDLPF